MQMLSNIKELKYGKKLIILVIVVTVVAVTVITTLHILITHKSSDLQNGNSEQNSSNGEINQTPIATFNLSQSNANTVPKTLLDINGSGNSQSQTFETSSNWQVSYSFDCSNIDSKSNFIYEVINADGSINRDVGANDISMSGANTNYYYDSGVHYFKITSLCNWHINVTN